MQVHQLSRPLLLIIVGLALNGDAGELLVILGLLGALGIIAI